MVWPLPLGVRCLLLSEVGSSSLRITPATPHTAQPDRLTLCRPTRNQRACILIFLFLLLCLPLPAANLRSYLYYCPSTGERKVLPVDVFGPRARPPPFKQLRVHPDGGMGPIPLYTGWTLGPVPKHVAAWAHAAKRTSADLEHQRSGGEGGAGDGAGGIAAGVEEAAAAAAEKERGDALLASVTAGQPGSKLPLVPAPDETFVSRDTGITGESQHWRVCVWVLLSGLG